MSLNRDKTFAKNEVTTWPFPNYWDFAALIVVLGIIVLIAWGARQMTTPYHLGQPIFISLEPRYLPYYALRSVLRMLIALALSLLFTFFFATWAAKNKRAERIIIPLIDVLQSVPVLAFLSIVIVPFIVLFPNSLMGPECAAIIAIFTSQVWNIALSFYQSVRTVPSDLREAAAMFHLSPWQSFWRIDVPFAMPALLWNIMISMSASWFFVVAAEFISVANQNIMLPGIGSYIALAVAKADQRSVIYALITMFVVIVLYDQLLFRPLSRWSERFKFEHEWEEETGGALLLRFFENTRLLRRCARLISHFWDAFVNISIFRSRPSLSTSRINSSVKQFLGWIVNIIIFISILIAAFVLVRFVFRSVTFSEAVHVFILGCITAARVMILIVICSIVWVPIGVWIGLRPFWTRMFQPIIQILAAFPANLFFPIFVVLIISYRLNPEIWTSPLMILGTQWYILFNVIAGASVLPKDILQATTNLNVSGWLWWKRLVIPAIFPYYVTGAITAAGGAWNASIIAEAVSWGSTKIYVAGLGAYITEQASKGDFPRLALGTAVMCLFVVVINRLIWRPLYNLAAERFRLD